MIFMDLTQFPYMAILHSLKSTNSLLMIIFIPLLTLFYIFKKITGTPFLSASLNSKTPKLHITDVKQFQKLHKKSFNSVSSFLQEHGFEPLIDLEDVSMAQGHIQHLTLNRRRKIYGTVHITKATGKVSYVTFSAFTLNNSFLSVDNTYALPVQTPDNLVLKHLPNASIESIYSEFLHTLEQMPEEPIELPLKTLLPNGYARREFIIEQGLEQGLLHIKGAEKKLRVSVCYHHPFNAAVRICSVCATALCEACYTEHQDNYYCQNCLPEDAKIAAPQKVATEGDYAGFGVRTVATLIDLSLIGLFATGVYFGSSHVYRLLIPGETSRAVPFLITQFIAVVSTILYLIAPLKKYGRTLGQKLLGLRVVDRYGNLPDTAATIVRFAYHLFACVFLFPLIGYLFIPFRKNKQGLHDQLAGTFVITRHPKSKALLSWCLLLAICGVIGWQAYQHPLIRSWFSWFHLPSSYSVIPEITLEAQWVKTFEQEDDRITSYVNRETLCVVSTATSLHALDMRTGNILWSVNDLPKASIQPLSKNPDFPLLARQYHPDGRWTLLNIDPASGAIIWQQELEGYEPQIMFDSKTILVYDDATVSCYAIDGTLLWKKHFQDQRTLDYAYFHTDVLLGRYSDQSLTLIYLARDTGEIIWEMKDSPYSPGYVIDKDLQFFYTEKDQILLLNVPEQKRVWDTPLDVGYVMGHDEMPSPGESKSSLRIYATSAAIRAEDGTIIFSYPPGSRFGAITKDFLILLRDNQQSEILLVDKSTGDVKHWLRGRPWFFVFYLTEDHSTIYLAANLKPEKPGIIEIHSELLFIDKQTFEFKEIAVGKNIGSLRFKIFPQENFVFIPSFQTIGGYNYVSISANSF